MNNEKKWSRKIDQYEPLQNLRDEIDSIDADIASLLVRRMATVRNIANQKIQSGIVFRPRREIEKMRMIEKIADERNLPPLMLFDLWRVIMSQSAMEQRPFQLLIYGSDQLALVATQHFGQSVPITTMHNLDDLLKAHEEDPNGIICLFDQQYQDWWQKVAQNAHLSLIAELPWRANATPQCYIGAHCPMDTEYNTELPADLLIWVHTMSHHISGNEKNNLSALCARAKEVRPHPDGTQFLLRLQDESSQQTPNQMIDSIKASVPQSWTIQLLGRFPRFHCP